MSSQDSLSYEDSSISEDDYSEPGDVTTIDRTYEMSSDPGQPSSEGGGVSVALPPSLTNDPSVNVIALTGSTALDVLDQVVCVWVWCGVRVGVVCTWVCMVWVWVCTVVATY